VDFQWIDAGASSIIHDPKDSNLYATFINVLYFHFPPAPNPKQATPARNK